MAALGKIRKRGVALVIIIGLGLFAFIAEEAFRSCEATKNQQRQQIGEVLGNSGRRVPGGDQDDPGSRQPL